MNSVCDPATLADFVDNEEFIAIKGREYFKNGILTFPLSTAPKEDRTYRTVFGPFFSNNGVVYAHTDHNVSLAFRRLTATREPDKPGVEEKLNSAQMRFCATHRELIERLRESYSGHFNQTTTAHHDTRLHHDAPHPKRRLRVEAWKDINDSGQVGDALWLHKVKYKMKKDEIGKPESPARMIGDLGIAASLQGFYYTSLMKYAMADEPLFYRGGEIAFCIKPSPSKLTEIFNKLIDPIGRFYFVYFSDDSCFSVRINNKVQIFNLDISKCDASHRPIIFQTLVELFPTSMKSAAQSLVDQCKLPISICSVSDPKIKVLLKPKRAKLYSGSTLTTILNNLANILIAICLAEATFTEDKLGQQVIHAVRRTGYIVKCEECPTPQDIQFLKHSPVYDTNGILRPLLNLGVLLRASGTCRGDLPGRGDLKIRAKKFQAALLQGMYPRVHFTLLDLLIEEAGEIGSDRTSIRCLKRVHERFKYKVDHDDKYDTFTVSDDQISKRYRLTELELLELHELAMFGHNYHLASRGVEKILEKDYSLRTLTRG